MSGDEKRRRGAALARRRDRLMNPTKFAERSGINRSQVTNVENGTAQMHTFARYEDALERLEAEVGVNSEAGSPIAREGERVEIEVIGSFGGRISARGSADDVDRLLKDAVAQLVHSMNTASQPQSA